MLKVAFINDSDIRLPAFPLTPIGTYNFNDIVSKFADIKIGD